MTLLPTWSFLRPNRDPPHRNRQLVCKVIPNEHGTLIEYTVASNWPRTQWWVSASFKFPDVKPPEYPRPGYDGFSRMRASNNLSTTSEAKAAQWVRDVEAGNIALDKG